MRAMRDFRGEIVREGDDIELVKYGVFVRGRYVRRLRFVRRCPYGRIECRVGGVRCFVNVLGDFPIRRVPA